MTGPAATPLPCRSLWIRCTRSCTGSPASIFAANAPGTRCSQRRWSTKRTVRLSRQQPGKQWDNRAHFFAVAARVVRAVLVDHARARGRPSAVTALVGVELAEEHASVDAPAVDVLDLDAALVELEAMDAEQSRIVELRYFAGLSIEETAEAMGTSPSTVKRGWLMAKTCIRRRLDRPVPDA